MKNHGFLHVDGYIRLDQFIINLLDDIMSSIFIGTFLNFYYFTLEIIH